MEEKATNELDEILKTMRPEQLKEYYKSNSQYLADEDRAFYNYFKSVIRTKNIRLSEVYLMAGFSEELGGQYVRMEKHARQRDYIIRLCLAGHFNLIEINRALTLYGYNALYAKDKRDACIITAINNRIYDIYDINDLLEQQDLNIFIMKDE